VTSVRWIRSVDELEASAAMLRELSRRAQRDLPAADPDFLRAYIRHFEYGDAPVPSIAVAERRGEPIGFLATRVGRHAMLGRVASAERTLLVTHDHDRVNLVSSPDDADDAANAIAEALAPSASNPALDIGGLVRGEPLHRALHAVATKSKTVVGFDMDLPPFCSVPVRHDSVEGYFKALSKTMRSNVSRQSRRLFAAGEVGLLNIEGPRAVERAMPAYFDVEQRSWKFIAKAGVLRSSKRTAFFHEVAAGQAAYDPSMVGVTLDGILIAALLLGRFRDSMWALEMSFDERHADLGAGQLLLVLAMRKAIGAGVTSLGYLQHFAYFKTRWLAEETPVVSTRLLRVGSPLHLRHLAGQSSVSRGKSHSETLIGRHDVVGEKPASRRRSDDGPASVALLERCVDARNIHRGADAAALLPFPVR
jgi:CelD/BcsL family acetyltransferase involved in cellulose biosynthesis